MQNLYDDFNEQTDNVRIIGACALGVVLITGAAARRSNLFPRGIYRSRRLDDYPGRCAITQGSRVRCSPTAECEAAVAPSARPSTPRHRSSSAEKLYDPIVHRLGPRAFG